MKGLQRMALALLAGGLVTAAAQAQDIRLYAFSSGPLTLGKGFLVNLAPLDPPVTVPVGFFVIRHPRGNVLFDTGNNDKLITDPNYWPPALLAFKPAMTPEVAIDFQLKKIGLTPDDITYVVVSHMHLDHGGNVGKFPKSTLVVQRDEMSNAFWPKAGTGLPPGDLYHGRENRTHRRVPVFNTERADTLASMDRVERIVKNTKARFVVQHDPRDFQALPRFPAFLD